MAWTTIKRIEDSKYNDNSKLVYFDFYNKEKFSILTSKVLEYLKIDKLKEGDNIYVIRTFNPKNDKEMYLIKKVHMSSKK